MINYKFYMRLAYTSSRPHQLLAGNLLNHKNELSHLIAALNELRNLANKNVNLLSLLDSASVNDSFLFGRFSRFKRILILS